MSLMQSLKEQTNEIHQQAHESIYFKQLFKHELPLESFVSSLRGLAIIHAVLERTLAASKDPFIVNQNRLYIPKLPLLSTDLLLYERELIQSDLGATMAALEIADEIMLLSQTDEMELLGYLYVLEGAMNGAKYTLPHIQKTFNLEPNYFLCYGENLEKNWKEFAQGFNTIPLEYHSSIIKGAKKLFSSLISFYDSCYPCSELVYHVTMVNPEAGNHDFPTDPLEIEAAIEATHIILEDDPYYRVFGERAFRFGKSDNGWLIALCESQQMEQQLMWLLTLLARLGIPSLLVEKNLILLHQYLIKNIPEKKEKYDKLLEMAAFIQSLRDKIMSAKEFQEHAKRFSQPIAGIGKLLMSAYIDEKNGFTNALGSMVKKLEDYGCDDKWLEEVTQTLSFIES